jgi:hypothetical protein
MATHSTTPHSTSERYPEHNITMALTNIHLVVLLLFLFLVASSSDIIELTEANFEHETQASTGQTTGKWFVLFSVSSFQDTVLEDLMASNLKEDILLAKVNAVEQEHVALRFGIRFYPTFLFFANQRMYEYKGPNTVDAIKTFLESRYKTMDGSIVPAPLSTILIWKRIGHNVLKEWSRFASNLQVDLDHIGEYRKNAAAALILMGVVSGIIIGIVAGRLLGRSQSEKSKKS